MTAEQIKKKILKNAAEIFQDYKVIFAYLYGSVALDELHPFSDLDIGLYTQPLSEAEGRKLELTLALAIDDKLRCATESDVRIMNSLPLVITGKIITDGILIFCADENQRIEYETRLRKAYFDFYPVIRHYRQTFLKKIRTEKA